MTRKVAQHRRLAFGRVISRPVREQGELAGFAGRPPATPAATGTPAAARRRAAAALRRPGPGLRQPAHADVRLPGPRPRLPGAGAWWPGVPWTAVAECAAGQEGAVAADAAVLPPPPGPDRQRGSRGVPGVRDVLRRAGGVQEQRAGPVGEPRGVGQGPLPRAGGDVRRVGLVQPAAQGRQAVVLPRRAERRGPEPVRPGQGQGEERARARHPGHAEVPRRARRSPGKGSGGWRRR